MKQDIGAMHDRDLEKAINRHTSEIGRKRKLRLANELQELWDDNEEHMGEQAAYQISCEQLGIDPDEGYDLLHMLD
jgi:hypothetical protein